MWQELEANSVSCCGSPWKLIQKPSGSCQRRARRPSRNGRKQGQTEEGLCPREPTLESCPKLGPKTASHSSPFPGVLFQPQEHFSRALPDESMRREGNATRGVCTNDASSSSGPMLVAEILLGKVSIQSEPHLPPQHHSL